MAEEEFVEALDPVITTNTKKKPRKKKVKKSVAEIEAPVDDQYLHSNKTGKGRQKGQRAQRRKSRSPSPQHPHALSASSSTPEPLTASAESEAVGSTKDEDEAKEPDTHHDITKSEDEEEQFSDQESAGGSPELLASSTPTPAAPPTTTPSTADHSDTKTASSVPPSPVKQAEPAQPVSTSTSTSSPVKEVKEVKSKGDSTPFVKADFTVKISPEDALAKIKKDVAFVAREVLESADSNGEGRETWGLCLSEVDTLLSIVSLGFAESAQKVYDLSVAVNKMATENKRLTQELAAAKARIAELEARPPPPLPEEDFAKLAECENALTECLQVVRPGEIVNRSRGGTPQAENSASESIEHTLGLCRKLVGSCSEAMTTLSRSEMALVQVKGDLRDAQESYFFSLALSIKQNLLSSNAEKGAELNSVPELFDMATRLQIPSSEWPKWISDNLVK